MKSGRITTPWNLMNAAFKNVWWQSHLGDAWVHRFLALLTGKAALKLDRFIFVRISSYFWCASDDDSPGSLLPWLLHLQSPTWTENQLLQTEMSNPDHWFYSTEIHLLSSNNENWGYSFLVLFFFQWKQNIIVNM